MCILNSIIPPDLWGSAENQKMFFTHIQLAPSSKIHKLNHVCIFLTYKHTFAEVCCVSEEVGEDVSPSADAWYQDHSLCLAETAEGM